MIEEKILLDIEITKRCLSEDIPELVKKILNLWLQYDYELLGELRKEKYEN